MLKIIKEIQKLRKINIDKPILIGITGRSRSGKTTFTKKLIKELKGQKIHTTIIHGDWYLRKTSKERKQWIHESFKGDVADYIKQVNTTQWWDFDRISDDISQLLKNKKVLVSPFYDVDTRKKNKWKITIEPRNGVILYENAILGDEKILKKIKKIFFLNTPDYQRLRDCITTDIWFRSTAEIIARMLLTNHGENIFFKNILKNQKDKICFIDRSGRKSKRIQNLQDTFYPIPIQNSSSLELSQE